MVLTEEQKQDIYPAATLEGDINSTNSAVYIENKYYSIDATKIVSKAQATGIENQNYPNNNTIVPNNNPNSVINAMSENLYELKANSTAGVTGLGITLKVMAGDKIDILGKSYYFTNVTNGNTNNKNIATLSILTGLLGGPTGGTAAAAHGGVTAGQLDVLTTTTDGIHSLFADQINEVPNSSLKPQAFINYIFFDEQFKSVDYGYDPVGDNSVVKSHYLQQKVAPKNGYVYIYVSNQSQVKVFFDNLQVVHTRGAILEETHYYPFGMTMAGISSKALNNAPENKKKYNGIEFNDDLDVYDAYYRNLDPQTGRWWQIDPKIENMEAWSPYASNYDNPITYSDPLGDEPSEDGPGPFSGIVDILDNTLLTLSGLVNGALNTVSGGLISTDPFSMRNNLSAEKQALYDHSVQVGQIGILFAPGSRSSTVTPALQPIGGPAIPASVTIKPSGVVIPPLSATPNQPVKNNTNGKENIGTRRQNRLPDKAEPNSTQTNKPGTTTKKYGPNGNVQKEFNKGHQGNKVPKKERSDHVHDYKPNPNNQSGIGDRQPGRPPKKNELKKDFGL